jgi:hypothetical protein
MMYGYVYPDVYTLKMGPSETKTVTVTASSYNCDEPRSVSYEIGDESLVSCAWGDSWSEDGLTIPLTITGKGRYGETTVNLTYYTDSGTLLDTDSITVRITPGYLVTEQSFIDMKLGETAALAFDVVDFSTAYRQMSYEISMDGIVDLSWGEWAENNTRLYLNLTAVGCNVEDWTYITVNLKNSDTGEIWDSMDVYVNVYGGEITCSQENGYFEIDADKSATATITGTPYVPGTKVSFEIVYSAEDATASFQLGEQVGNTVPITVTATRPGYSLAVIYMSDSSGQLLAKYWVDVLVLDVYG